MKKLTEFFKPKQCDSTDSKRKSKSSQSKSKSSSIVSKSYKLIKRRLSNFFLKKDRIKSILRKESKDKDVYSRSRETSLIYRDIK